MTSCVQFSARPGVGGIPPIVRGAVLSDWFTITSIGTTEAPEISVSEGRIVCPNVTGIDGATPSITSFLRELTVATADFSVADGDKVYCKVTASELSVANAYTGTDTDEYVEVTVNARAKVWHATSGEIVVLSSAPTVSATTGYVLLADISVVDGVVQILQRHRGAVFAGTVTAPYGANPTVTTGFTTATYTICDSGSAVDVEFVVVPAA